MARYPNVYCKASGMFATDPKWDQKSVDMVVKPLFEIFGCDRSVKLKTRKVVIIMCYYMKHGNYSLME